MSIGQAAQTVQRSAHPTRYDEQLAEAKRVYAQVSGGKEPGIDVDAYDEYKAANPTMPNPLEWIRKPENWQRIGFFALGAFLLVFVAYSLLANSPAAHTAVKAVIK